VLAVERPPCVASYEAGSVESALGALSRRSECLSGAVARPVRLSLRALHVYVELDTPRVSLGDTLRGIAWYQNELDQPLEIWLDPSRLDQAVRIVPDASDAAAGSSAPPTAASVDEPCEPSALPRTLLHFTIPSGARVAQSFEWMAAANGIYRIDLAPPFPTCIVDPSGVRLDGVYFGVPGHPPRENAH
jgi:hypothetical protein